MIDPDGIKEYIDKSVLCWLATVSIENIPNVSPKEVFLFYGESQIIVANIASPQTVKNIKDNENVCVSFIDIFLQKGLQVKGKARIITSKQSEYDAMEKELFKLTKGKFPFSKVIVITIEHVKPIIAPKYILFPETTEEEQIASAIESYGMNKI